MKLRPVLRNQCPECEYASTGGVRACVWRPARWHQFLTARRQNADRSPALCKIWRSTPELCEIA